MEEHKEVTELTVGDITLAVHPWMLQHGGGVLISRRKSQTFQCLFDVGLSHHPAAAESEAVERLKHSRLAPSSALSKSSHPIVREKKVGLAFSMNAFAYHSGKFLFRMAT